MELDNFITNTGRPLPVFLLLDVSGSMTGTKIDTLNECVREMIKDFKNERMSEVALKLCIITFGEEEAKLHTPLSALKDVEFENLQAKGMTPLGSALNMASKIINDKEQVSGKGYRPVVVLVSDGYPNDSWEQPLNEFVNGKRTSKCEKWALGIGDGYDANMLQKFLGDTDKKVFDASVAKEITKFFKFVTLSTIARSKSQDPNSIINITDLEEQVKDEMPNFDFGL